MLEMRIFSNEAALRRAVEKNLRKEVHAWTKPSIDFIKKILDEAYESGLVYDISDMEPLVYDFASNSTHQAKKCLAIVREMHFTGKDIPNVETREGAFAFYDCEVFPNLFVVCYKFEGEDQKVTKLINPSPAQIEKLVQNKLIDFNGLNYDCHILYARMLGKSNEELYDISQGIINGTFPKYRDAYKITYLDIYDCSSKKQSLKKWEIELGIHHKELGLPWDQPVPEELWDKVADYCCNDVVATEAVFHHLKGDVKAREILADIAGMPIGTRTNTLTERIIFRGDKNPQREFNYRDLGNPKPWEYANFFDYKELKRRDYKITPEDHTPIFPGYSYHYDENAKKMVSMYRGEDVGMGGYVYAEPGIYYNVALLDIASMHPSSIIAENLFGKYTKNFKELLDIRISIKHKDYDTVRNMMDGKLAKYMDDPTEAKALSNALKIAINSVYGLTSASFKNAFKDDRNKDNIVAKRGALFMVDLKHAVQERGFKVAHIKTDSIKIPNATPEIIQFVMDFGKAYGYNFEHEATYDRMCLVNDAVYIARYASEDWCMRNYGYVPEKCHGNDIHWDATGKQFQVPYVFKKLFSREPIEFADICETKSVQTAIYLDLNEDLPEGEHDYRFVGKVGAFCPMESGYGGGSLMREKDSKYYNVGGAKGYRWLEAEDVKGTKLEKHIDISYYDKMVKDAEEAISKYGNFDNFVSAEESPDLGVIDIRSDELPF